MIIKREGIAAEKFFTCPREIAAGLLEAQKERLIPDPDRLFRLLGHQVYSLFANFSNAEILDAVREAEVDGRPLLTITLVSDTAKVTADDIEKRVANRLLEVRR